VPWSTRGFDMALETARGVRPAIEELVNRGARAGGVAAKTLSASRDAALATAEKVSRDEGADLAADALHSVRSATGVLDGRTSPTKKPTRTGQRVVSAAQTRVAAIAQEVVGIG
jgi:hypothetical protein